MKTILTADNNWAIGKDGGMLVHLPGDLKYFKEKTIGKVVVMGRATLESLPGKRPLKDRVNIVLSRSLNCIPDCIHCKSVDELFEVLKNYDMDDVFIIGGQDIYRQFLPYCSSHLVTRINGDYEADRFFENLDLNDNFELAWESEIHNDNGVEYRFTEYRRK